MQTHTHIEYTHGTFRNKAFSKDWLKKVGLKIQLLFVHTVYKNTTWKYKVEKLYFFLVIIL